MSAAGLFSGQGLWRRRARARPAAAALTGRAPPAPGGRLFAALAGHVAFRSLATLGAHEAVEAFGGRPPPARAGRPDHAVEVVRGVAGQPAGVPGGAEALPAPAEQPLVAGRYRREQGVDGGENLPVGAHLGRARPPHEPANE